MTGSTIRRTGPVGAHRRWPSSASTGSYLNVYRPGAAAGGGRHAYFFLHDAGRPAVPSSALMAPITQRFVNAIKRYAEDNGIDIGVVPSIASARMRAAQEYLRDWSGDEGVLYIGKAQEKSAGAAHLDAPPALRRRGADLRVRWSHSTAMC